MKKMSFIPPDPPEGMIQPTHCNLHLMAFVKDMDTGLAWLFRQMEHFKGEGLPTFECVPVWWNVQKKDEHDNPIEGVFEITQVWRFTFQIGTQKEEGDTATGVEVLRRFVVGEDGGVEEVNDVRESGTEGGTEAA